LLDVFKFVIGDCPVITAEEATDLIASLLKYTFDSLRSKGSHIGIDAVGLSSVLPLLLSEVVTLTVSVIGKDRVSKLGDGDWERLLSPEEVLSRADRDGDGNLSLHEWSLFLLDLCGSGTPTLSAFSASTTSPYIEVKDSSRKLPFSVKLIEVLISISIFIGASSVKASSSISSSSSDSTGSSNSSDSAAVAAGPPPSLKSIFQRVKDDDIEDDDDDGSSAHTSAPASRTKAPAPHALRKAEAVESTRNSTAADYSTLYAAAGAQQMEVNVHSSQHLIKAGVLLKKGFTAIMLHNQLIDNAGMGKNSLGFYRPWAKRYFVLRSDRTLSYYAAEGGELKGKEFLHAG
jgi:hypothetical protein